MSDYRKYCSLAGITNGQMIECLRSLFPKYSKATQSMVCDPWGYAVQLVPEAEKALVSAFGYAPGLADDRPPRKHSHGNKAKPNRLYVRLDDDLMVRVKATMDRMSFATAQDFIEAALYQMVEKYGGAS